jgi:integrase-like protein
MPCGYALANKGFDTRTLQAYLGHRSINSTTRYAALAPGRFDHGVRRLGQFLFDNTAGDASVSKEAPARSMVAPTSRAGAQGGAPPINNTTVPIVIVTGDH